MTGKTIFITGASNGIGKSLAEQAAAAGHQVRTTGRSGGDMAKDLIDEDAPQVLADFARGADIAVLNAAVAPGVGVETEFLVNLTRQMQLAILLLKQNPEIRLAFVGSVISGALISAYPAYCAAKAGIAAFARALAAEYPGQILLYHPAGTQSKFMERTGITNPGHLDKTEAVAGRLLTLLERLRYPWRRPSSWKAWAIDWVAKLALINGPKVPAFAGGKTLVTGAKSGLGKALALARPGLDGIDLPEVDLRAPLPTDLPPADRLINCAGITWTGRTADMPYDKIAELVAVNLIAPVRLEQQLAPQQTVQISSLSHQIGYPYAAVYAATKSALATWGRCRGHLVVYPGPMDTPQAAQARLGGEPSKAIADPAHVAQQILRASARGQRQLVPGLANKALRIFGRLLPHMLTAAFARDQRRRLSE